MNFCHVYILQSGKYSDRFYVGLTDDLKARLRHHNQGCCDYTRPHRPWRIKTAIAFTDRNQALRISNLVAYLTPYCCCCCAAISVAMSSRGWNM